MAVLLNLSGIESIEQNIGIILRTRKGSVPFRPNMGVGIEDWIDKVRWSSGLALEIIDQLTTYEPRIKIKQVLHTGSTVAKANISVIYNIKGENEQNQATFTI